MTQLIPHHLFCWWSEAPKVFWHTTELDIQRGRFVAFAQSITGVRDTSCWNPSPKTFHGIIVVTSTSIPGEAGPRSASEKTCSEIFNLWNLGGLGILVNRHHGIFPTPSPPNDDTQTPIRIVTIIVLIGKSYNIFGRLETCVTSTDLTKDMAPPKKYRTATKTGKKRLVPSDKASTSFKPCTMHIIAHLYFGGAGSFANFGRILWSNWQKQ